MEIEMKYAIPGREKAEEIWEEACRDARAEASSIERLVMKAIYFDTEDRTLARNNVVVRVRAEGERTFATLKWGGKTGEDGLHETEEVNIPVSGEVNFISLPSDIFKESEDGRKMLELIGDKPLVNLLETRFLRSRMRVLYGGSLMELSVDVGSIVTDAAEEPICELEIELFAGKTSDIQSLGSKLQKQYGLTPEPRTKFARGFALINGHNNN